MMMMMMFFFQYPQPSRLSIRSSNGIRIKCTYAHSANPLIQWDRHPQSSIFYLFFSHTSSANTHTVQIRSSNGIRIHKSSSPDLLRLMFHHHAMCRHVVSGFFQNVCKIRRPLCRQRLAAVLIFLELGLGLCLMQHNL